VLNGIVGEAAFSDRFKSTLIVWGVSDVLAPLLSTAVVVTMITLATILFGELVPKRIAQLHPERVASAVSGLMRIILIISIPIVRLLSNTTTLILRLLGVSLQGRQSVTEEEINASLDEGVSAGLIEDHEHQMVKNVFHLDERQLTSMMVPRADIVWLDAKLTPKEAIDEIKLHSPHSWYPVCRNSLDDVIGVIGINQLLQHIDAALSLEDFVLPVAFVPETLTGLDLLEQFQNPRRIAPAQLAPTISTSLKSDSLAKGSVSVVKAPAAQGVSGRLVLVVDEYGVLHGLITPKDVLEAITGELLQSTAQDQVWATLRSDGTWLLDGLMPIQELKSRLEMDELPGEDRRVYNTLAGLIMAILGRLPVLGDTADCGEWQLEVLALDERRISSVVAKKRSLI
jgi:putative hemolysin